MHNKINVKYISTDNMSILKEYNSLMVSERDSIINQWLENDDVKTALYSLNMDAVYFKDTYAYKIYEHFLGYTTTNTEPTVCPAAKSFFEENLDQNDTIQLVSIVCNGFKDILFNSIIFSDLDNKLLIYKQFNILFSANTAILLTEYTNYMNKVKENYEYRLSIVEEHSIISKSDKYGVIKFVSEPFCKALGYTKEELIGQKYNLFRHPDVPSRVYKEMWKLLKAGKIWEGRLKNYTESKEEVIFHTKILPEFDFNNEIIGYTAIKTDLTAKVNNGIDKLTGIMNRAGFDNEFDKIAKQKCEHITNVVLIDIDYFKSVNDNFGHIVGDSVLKTFVKVINKEIRPTDIFARWGGEEFALILIDTTMEDALIITERIRKAIETTEFGLVGYKTASFGIGTYTDKCESSLMFIENVDKALYHSKNNGRNKISYFDKATPIPMIFKPI